MLSAAIFVWGTDPAEAAHNEPPHLDLLCLPLSNSQYDIACMMHFFLNFADVNFFVCFFFFFFLHFND